MTKNQPGTIDQQLCFSLYSASLAMTQLYKPLLEPLGLTYAQYLIMLILWEKDGISLKDIGERLGQKSGALTPVLKRLEQDALVERIRDTRDERALSIKLTTKGDAMRHEAASVGPCIARACGMPLPDLIDLKARLDLLRSNLHAGQE
ncbi:MarR family transcriptional regulator [uncultured Cohaesibacter sp.]|uniref:MarR family winged helix-turn-helix transcriptional regulator n=1 Tax=uncultured Cohaesibacter sp. TaxID=1002546 RepID=UPI00292E4CB6|nr:MarR family transcriptional regulator [uncultured Cohaesibacter sp.]